MTNNCTKKTSTQAACLKSDGLLNSDVDLYTALLIFINNLLKYLSHMQDAIDSGNIDKLEMLMGRFQSQCEAIFLTKISEKAALIKDAISQRNIESIGRNFDSLRVLCADMTLSKPETVSMLVEMKKKIKESQTSQVTSSVE